MATTPITYSIVRYGTSSDNKMNYSSDTGNVKMFGLNGNDTMIGALYYHNFLDGGDGVDTITGGNLADFIFGRNGDDILNGGAGNDELYGGANNDTLNGGSDNDDLYGGANNDTLNGGSGIDELWGGDGDDTLIGGASYDVIDAGAGKDVVIATSGDQINFGGGDNARDIIVINQDFGYSTIDYVAGSGYTSTGYATLAAFETTFSTGGIVVQGVDKIDVRSLLYPQESFIFDTSFSEGGATEKASIYIGSGFVAIDYKNDNNYDIVLLLSTGQTVLQSDFMLA